MRGNGSEHGNGAEGDRAKITYEEARALVGPPRDRVDKLAMFAADQCEDLRKAIAAQAKATTGMIELMNERFRLNEGEIVRLGGEIARLRTAQLRARIDFGDEDEGSLQ